MFAEVGLEPGNIGIHAEVPAGAIAIRLTTCRATGDIGVDADEGPAIVELVKSRATGVTGADAFAGVTGFKAIGTQSTQGDFCRVLAIGRTTLRSGLDQSVTNEEDLAVDPDIGHGLCVDGHGSNALDVFGEDGNRDIVDNGATGCSTILRVTNLLCNVVVFGLKAASIGTINAKLDAGRAARCTVSSGDDQSSPDQGSGTERAFARLHDHCADCWLAVVYFSTNDSLLDLAQPVVNWRLRLRSLFLHRKTSNEAQESQQTESREAEDSCQFRFPFHVALPFVLFRLLSAAQTDVEAKTVTEM